MSKIKIYEAGEQLNRIANALEEVHSTGEEGSGGEGKQNVSQASADEGW